MTEPRWAPHFEPPPPPSVAGDDEGVGAAAPGGVAVGTWAPPPPPRSDRPGAGEPEWVMPPAGGWGDGGWGDGTWSGGDRLPPPPPPPTPRPGRGPGTLIAGIVLAVIIGFLGGGLVLHRTTASSPTGLGLSPSPSVAPAPSVTPTPASPGGATSTSTLDVAAIAAKVDPTVVDITTRLGSSGTAAGTGMVLTSDGQVLTNNHVIDGATAIRGQINGTGPTYTAKVLGTDPTADVALIQLQGVSGLKTVTMADSTKVAVGDPVVAIGNALGLGGTPAVSAGTVRALNQSVTAGDPSAGTAEDLTGMIQIDATLKPGDSGGPLVNAKGEVVGMDTAASVGGGRFRSGSVGFAVPINRAMSIVTQIRTGRASDTIQIGQPGFLGVQVTTVASAENNGIGGSDYTPPVDAGAVIVGVVPNGPADGAGVAAGDVVVGVDGKAVDAPSALTPILHAHHPGDSVQLSWVDKAGKHHDAKVKLTTAPTG